MIKRSFIIVFIVFLFASVLLFLSISCTENNISPEERPKSVAWVNVKTGLADSTKTETEAKLTKEQYAYKLNNDGYVVSWSRVDDADYYEVRVSKDFINKKNWDNAVLAKTVANKDTAIITVNVDVKPDISGNNCTGCKLCLPACPRNAIQIFKGKAVIDPDSCVGCGQCYEVCPYNAVKDLTLGKYYYFAVRAFKDDNIPAEDVVCTYSAFTLRYKNAAYRKSILGVAPWCGFCGAGCFILDPTLAQNIELGGCPVNAIYYDPDPDPLNNRNIVYIDQSKCIYCGLCVLECGYNNGKWSVRREVISSQKPIDGVQ